MYIIFPPTFAEKNAGVFRQLQEFNTRRVLAPK